VAGQDKPGGNSNLAMRYHHATGDKAKMRDLVDEGYKASAWKEILSWV